MTFEFPALSARIIISPTLRGIPQNYHTFAACLIMIHPKAGNLMTPVVLGMYWLYHHWVGGLKLFFFLYTKEDDDIRWDKHKNHDAFSQDISTLKYGPKFSGFHIRGVSIPGHPNTSSECEVSFRGPNTFSGVWMTIADDRNTSRDTGRVAKLPGASGVI